jgi:hypothetical protein
MTGIKRIVAKIGRFLRKVEREKMKFDYFVSYFYQSDDTAGFGSINIRALKPVRSIEDVMLVSCYIRDKHISGENKSVIILNWRRYDGRF